MTSTSFLPAPTLEHVLDLDVSVDPPIDAGILAGLGTQGRRRIIPIIGGVATGQFQGQRIQGRGLPGGADFQRVPSDTCADLDARYLIAAGRRLGGRAYLCDEPRPAPRQCRRCGPLAHRGAGGPGAGLFPLRAGL